jgi:hypothetical protein
LGDYLAYWLREVVEPNLTPGSYVTYEAITRLYIAPGLGSERLGFRPPGDCAEQVGLSDAGRCRTPTGGGVGEHAVPPVGKYPSCG